MLRTPSPTRRVAPKVLSQYARNILAALAEEPKAADAVNPGLTSTLQERGLVEIEERPAKARSKKRISMLCLTPAGREELARYA
jgi:DNA-binding MarR family transcriptional regulator